MHQSRNRIPEPVEAWCVKHGHTEPFCHEGYWWAFPPHGVNPVPLPVKPLPLQYRIADDRPPLASVQRRLLSYFLASIICPACVYLLYKALDMPPEFFIGFIGFAVTFFTYLTLRGLLLIVEYWLR
ncbi:MAG: hypothetical protein AAFQ89_18005 [Cyanobacteria bacterium J06626_18]